MDRLIKPDKTNTRLPPTPPAPHTEEDEVEVALPQTGGTTDEKEETDGV